MDSRNNLSVWSLVNGTFMRDGQPGPVDDGGRWVKPVVSASSGQNPGLVT